MFFGSYLPQLRKFYGFLVALLRLDIHRWPRLQFWRAECRGSNPRLSGEYWNGHRSHRQFHQMSKAKGRLDLAVDEARKPETKRIGDNTYNAEICIAGKWQKTCQIIGGKIVNIVYGRRRSHETWNKKNGKNTLQYGDISKMTIFFQRRR